jgi:hypothetical protein
MSTHSQTEKFKTKVLDRFEYAFIAYAHVQPSTDVSVYHSHDVLFAKNQLKFVIVPISSGGNSVQHSLPYIKINLPCAWTSEIAIFMINLKNSLCNLDNYVVVRRLC